MDNHAALRLEILTAAREGRATYLPAGARDNAIALILVDGVVIGGAASLGHFVRTLPDAPRFGESKLVPEAAWKLPKNA